MNLKNIKPYHLFFTVAFLILLIGIKSQYEGTNFSINIHDTYYVIANFHLAIIFFAFYLIQGFGYWIVQKLIKKKLVRRLTIFHSFILIGSFVYYWIFVGYYELLADSPHPLFDDYHEMTNITLTILALLIFIIAVPTFIINLLIGIFRKADR